MHLRRLIDTKRWRVRVFLIRRREIHTSTHIADPSSIIFAVLRHTPGGTRWPLDSSVSGRDEQWDSTIGTGRRQATWTLWMQPRLTAANVRSARLGSPESTRRKDILNAALNEKGVL